MLDKDLLFSDAQVVSADAYSTNAIKVAKTPPEGVWIEVIITAKSGAGVTALNAVVLAKDADSGWDYTAVGQKIGFLNLGDGSVNRFFIRVQTKLQYIKLYYDITLSANDVTITAGISSGPQRDTAA